MTARKALAKAALVLLAGGLALASGAGAGAAGGPNLGRVVLMAAPLSNEVVSYRPGGAEQALREVRHAVDHCPTGPVKAPDVGAPKLTWKVSRIADSKLLPGSLAVRISPTGTLNGVTRSSTGFAFYQAKGNVLSGLYAYKDDATTRRTTLHAAEASAQNLKRWA